LATDRAAALLTHLGPRPRATTVALQAYCCGAVGTVPRWAAQDRDLAIVRQSRWRGLLFPAWCAVAIVSVGATFVASILLIVGCYIAGSVAFAVQILNGGCPRNRWGPPEGPSQRLEPVCPSARGSSRRCCTHDPGGVGPVVAHRRLNPFIVRSPASQPVWNRFASTPALWRAAARITTFR